MSLWIPWWNAIRRLRPAFSRLRTFLWFATAVAGFTVRTELLGVTSLVIDRIVICQDGRAVAQHDRRYGRGETIYDPWHYVPVLARKPGAFRNGAPFKDWMLPAGLDRHSAPRRAGRPPMD